jgi:hypothetical protein
MGTIHSKFLGLTNIIPGRTDILAIVDYFHVQAFNQGQSLDLRDPKRLMRLSKFDEEIHLNFQFLVNLVV